MKLFPVLVALIFVTLGCTIHSQRMPAVPRFDKEGHRGCRGLMPENTIPAMLYAMDLGVTTLEMDVHITKDSQVVLSHDPWMNSNISTKPDGTAIAAADERYILFQMDYDSIRQFDVGSRLYPAFPRQQKLKVYKPLLKDLIDSVERHGSQTGRRMFYNIEIKSAPAGDHILHPAPAIFAERVMEVLKQKNMVPHVVLQSFDVRSLQYLHQHYPQVTTSLLVEDDDHRAPADIVNGLGFVPNVYSPHYSLVTTELVTFCHQKGMRLIPWTVNDLSQMKQLKQMGVDGLISDYPDLYRQL